MSASGGGAGSLHRVQGTMGRSDQRRSPDGGPEPGYPVCGEEYGPGRRGPLDVLVTCLGVQEVLGSLKLAVGPGQVLPHPLQGYLVALFHVPLSSEHSSLPSRAPKLRGLVLYHLLLMRRD
jgi:hypothetical protein